MNGVLRAWRRARDLRDVFERWRALAVTARCEAGQAAIAAAFRVSQLLARAFGGWARVARRGVGAREHAASVLRVPAPSLRAMGDEDADAPLGRGVSVLYGARLKGAAFRRWRADARS